MTGEYDLNLSNGSVFSTLYPLETNGPDNTSTARLLQEARPTFPTLVANSTTNTFTILGDYTNVFRVGFIFEIVDAAANNGSYTVSSVSFDGTNTLIGTSGVTDASLGNIIAHVFRLNSDLTYRMVPGFTFTVQNSSSGLIDGTYTVDALGSFYETSSDTTIIPVGNGSIRDQITIPSIGLPLGSVVYTIQDTVSSLQLPGKGTLNYGEKLIENLLRITENFASDSPPDLNTILGTSPAATPLIGQLWYNTTTGEEGLQVYGVGGWTNDSDLDAGALILRDVENANADIYITASETNLTGFAGTLEPGLVIWGETNPSAGDPIFRVLQADGTESLRVEFNGYTKTDNNLEVMGVNDSFIYGGLGIGNTNTPLTHLLEVNGLSFFNGLIDASIGYESSVVSDTNIPNVAYVEAPMRAEKEPTGFANRVDSVLSFVDASRTFTITPVGSYDYWIHGAKYTITSAKNIIIGDVEGLHFVYLDNTENLQEITMFDPEILLADNAYVAVIYWDATNKEAIYIGEERHGLTMDASTHIHFHLTHGTQFVSGLALGNFSIDGNGTTNGHAQFDTGDGIIRDEDIQIDIVSGSPQILTPAAQIPILYRLGASGNWRLKAANDYPLIYSGTAGYTGAANGLAPYNQFTGGSWQLTELTDGRYCLVHYFATNDINHPIVGIQGTNEYINNVQARDGANSEIAGLAGLPFQEFTPIGTVIFQASTTFTNQPLVTTISTDLGENYVDWRDTSAFTSTIGGGGINDHGNLSGLTDDDHLQYLNRSGVRAMTGDLTLANNTPTADEHATSKLFVETHVGSISWKEPVVAIDDNVYANSAAFPTGGIIDGVTLTIGDRVLFSETTLVADRDIFIWNGTSWDAAETNPPTIGDTTYVGGGTRAKLAYAFDENDKWSLLGVGSGINVRLEEITAVASQLVFNLSSIRYSLGTNRLQVYVDGIKQIINAAYTETSSTSVTFIGPSPFVGGEVVEFIAYDELHTNAVAKREEQTGIIGSPVTINFASITYQQGSDNLLVFVDGIKATVGTDYTESTDSSISWIGTALTGSENLEFYVSVPIVAGTKLRDVDDVSTAVPNNNDTLVYNSTSGLWEPSTAASSAGVDFDYIVGVTGTVVNTTNVTTQAKTATISYQQVFLNGVLQREDVSGFPASGNYYVSGANQITLATALVATDEILIYEL